MKKKTSWHYWNEGSSSYRMRLEYGIDYAFARRQQQDPYFTMFGDVDYRMLRGEWVEEARAWPQDIKRVFPAFYPYLKWDGVGPNGPIHYLTNAKYWWKAIRGQQPTVSPNADAVDRFKQSIKLGAFPGDAMHFWKGPKEWSPRGPFKSDLLNVQWLDVASWLEERLPKLQAAWVVDMAELGVLEE